MSDWEREVGPPPNDSEPWARPCQRVLQSEAVRFLQSSTCIWEAISQSLLSTSAPVRRTKSISACCARRRELTEHCISWCASGDSVPNAASAVEPQRLFTLHLQVVEDSALAFNHPDLWEESPWNWSAS